MEYRGFTIRRHRMGLEYCHEEFYDGAPDSNTLALGSVHLINTQPTTKDIETALVEVCQTVDILWMEHPVLIEELERIVLERWQTEDKPQEGKVYALTSASGPCIAKGNSWEESEVK